MTETIHTHIRATMKNKWYKVLYENKWIDKNRSPEKFLEALLPDLRKSFVIKTYTEVFSYDPDGSTEYIHINFQFHDTEDLLTVHVFSDYCADFAEGDQPPF